MNRTRTVLVSIAALALALAPTALAGKPGSGGGGAGGGTISLAPVVVDANHDGLPNWGDIVTFNISTTATTSPFVNLLCYQNGVLVANGWNGFFDGALNPTRNFGLYSGMWTSGAASCTANLDKQGSKGSWVVLASTKFSVYA